MIQWEKNTGTIYFVTETYNGRSFAYKNMFIYMYIWYLLELMVGPDYCLPGPEPAEEKFQFWLSHKGFLFKNLHLCLFCDQFGASTITLSLLWRSDISVDVIRGTEIDHSYKWHIHDADDTTANWACSEQLVTSLKMRHNGELRWESAVFEQDELCTNYKNTSYIILILIHTKIKVHIK